MRKFRWLWSVPILVFVLAAPTHAVTTLFTPALDIASGDILLCGIVNTGSKAITLTIEIVDTTGAVIVEEDFEVSPGAVRAAGAGVVPPAETRAAYCHFIGDFSKSEVRAAVSVFSAGRTIAVAPAE